MTKGAAAGPGRTGLSGERRPSDGQRRGSEGGAGDPTACPAQAGTAGPQDRFSQTGRSGPASGPAPDPAFGPAPGLTAVLVANGPLVDDGLLRARAAGAHYLVGVDGGAQTLLSLGLFPTIVTGDFDSLNQTDRDTLAKRGAQIIPTPDQDFSDLDKALGIALDDLGARTVFVFGALGGRLDHTVAAMSALVKHGRRGAKVCLLDHIGVLHIVNGALRFSGDDLVGRVVSLLALGLVENIWSRGVRWPLSGESLAPGVRDGTSNEITESNVEIRVGKGDLLVFLHHAAAPPP